MRLQKKMLTGGFVFMVALLAGASAVFACTVYRGNLTGTGNGSGNQSTTVTGAASGTFQWCGDTPSYSADDTVKKGFWKTRVKEPDEVSGGSLTLSTAVDSTSGCRQSKTVKGKTTLVDNFLETGMYTVGISNGYWDESDEGWDPNNSWEEDNCHSLNNSTDSQPGYGTRIDIEGFSITNGVGSKTYSGSAFDNAVGAGWNTACVYLNNSVEFAPANAMNFYSL